MSMKNKLIIVLGILAVLFLAAWATVSYDAYRKRHDAEVTSRQAAQQIADQKMANSYQQAIERATALRAQCEVGLNAYNQLPVATKAKTAMPDCSLSFQ